MESGKDAVDGGLREGGWGLLAGGLASPGLSLS